MGLNRVKFHLFQPSHPLQGLLAWLKQSDAARANSAIFWFVEKREGELRKPENINLKVCCSRKKTDDFFPTYGRLWDTFILASTWKKHVVERYVIWQWWEKLYYSCLMIQLALRSFLLSWCCISVIWVVVQCGVGRVLSECCTTGTQIAAQDPRYIRLYRIL